MSTEVVNTSFTVVRRGYDRSQVDEAVGTLLATLDEAVAEREAAVEKLEVSEGEARDARASAAKGSAELAKLRDQVAELSTVPSTVDGMSTRLQEMVRTAQDEVNEMRSRATATAAKVLRLAEAEAEELRERSSRERLEFEAERRAAQESLSKQLAESQTRLEQLRNDSSGWRSQLENELAQRKADAEKALDAEIDRRKAKLLGDLKDSEAEHRKNQARIREAADEQARSKLAEATVAADQVRTAAHDSVGAAQREVEGLKTLRHQVAEQLTSVRALLDWTLPQLGVATQPQSDTGDAKPATTTPGSSATQTAAEPADTGDRSTATSARAPSPVPVRTAPATDAPAHHAAAPRHPIPPARAGSKTSQSRTG